MAALTVWKFDSPEGADQALSKLIDLQRQQLIKVIDAATVTWPQGQKKPKTNQLHSTTQAGALGGTFWGMLIGLIFFVPILGAAVGAAMGALTGALTDVGIDDSFIADVRNKVTEGSSALFLMSADAVVDRVRSEMGDIHAELIQTNLSTDQEEALRSAFGEPEEA